MPRDIEYEALPADPESPEARDTSTYDFDDKCSSTPTPGLARNNNSSKTGRQGRFSWLPYICTRNVVALTQLVLTLLFAGLWLSERSYNRTTFNFYPQQIYSPLQDVIKFKPMTFWMGLGEKNHNIYQKTPSPETDQAWKDLYHQLGISQIPKWQARLLPNKTSAIPGDEQNYVVSVEVFHQLHCLDYMRKAIYVANYTDPKTGTIAGMSIEKWNDHISHCIETVRQALVCASDVSLTVWQWSDKLNRTIVSQEGVHSCRNFDAILDWGKDHRLQTEFDYFTHVPDDIVISNSY